MKILSLNPYTEEINEAFEALGMEACRDAVRRAREALPGWRGRSFAERAEAIRRLAGLLERKKEPCARIITREMGKPIRQSLGEIEKCAWVCRYYADNAERLLQDEPAPTEALKSYVTFEPLGVILGIMPWNFPFWQVFRFAIPTMAAGNVCLLKHASNVPITAVEIERLFGEAGFPVDAFQTLLIGASFARQIVEEGLVDGVSLTGSVPAGAQIGAAAGQQIRTLVLELGGSDPLIVLEDADIDKAAAAAVQGRNINTGQSCIAAKRFIVMESVADAFRERFIAHLRAQRIGDPMEAATDIGPLAKQEFLQALQEQLDDAIAKGAEVAYGPELPSGKGFFFRPAVVSRVTEAMKVVTEEVFGPVAPILVVRTEEEAVQAANATEFGLGASIWTGDTERGEALARRIAAGFVAINDLVKSDPRLPFGGVKRSGVGRELSHFGLKAFVNIKTVVVNRV